MTDNTQSDVVEAAYREGFLDAHEGSARFEAEREADAYWNISNAKVALASLSTKDDARSDRDAVVEALSRCTLVSNSHKQLDMKLRVANSDDMSIIAQAIRNLKGDR